MADEFNVVTIWLGTFPSEKRLAAYFDETYSEDDVPISDFAREQAENFYDHDFVETSFHERATDNVPSLLRGHSFATSFSGAVEQRAREIALTSVNTVVLVWNHEIEEPRSVRGADYNLELIGTFPCDPKAQ